MPKKFCNKIKRKILETNENDEDDEDNKIKKRKINSQKESDKVIDSSTSDSHIELNKNGEQNLINDESKNKLVTLFCNNDRSIPYDLSNNDRSIPYDLSNNDRSIPYDLSTKSKSSEIDNPGSESEKDFRNSEDEESTSESPKTLTSQEIFLAHVSKIQQNFLSNLFQYQANFLAHYHQIQQQMSAKENSEDAEENDENKSVNDKDDCSQTSIKDSHEKTSNLLENLFPLYPNLLPVTSSTGSTLPPLNVSNLFTNSTTSLSSGYGENIVSSSDKSVCSKKRIKTTNKKDNIESAISKKYTLLQSLIGSSKNKFKSSCQEDYEDNELDNLSNSLQYKRKRIAFSAKQYELLQTTFEHNNFPEPGDQQCIARQLKAPYRSIKMWFQNKRANARKKLLPGEKGSGRTVSGEKIPGDTDTRFYCDKCPSAFICQKYLNNHMHAHSLYTKSCPKCHVVFTHECLLTTHTLAKCGKDDHKNEFCEDDDELLDLKFLSKDKYINGDNKDTLLSVEEKNDDVSHIPSTILSHLNSNLPLLTLLQIQKKQEEQKLLDVGVEEQDDDYEGENSDNESGSEKLHIDVEPTQNNSEEQSQNELNEETSKLDVKIGVKDIPPLIPSQIIQSKPPNDSKFAILRHLLTNFKQDKELKINSNNHENANDLSISNQMKNDLSETEDKPHDPNYKPPQNIPQHLYQLLDHQNGLNPPKIIDVSSLELSDKSDENVDKLEIDHDEKPEISDGGKFIRAPKVKRLRRRTTVFTENQHRILYLHFTHCNFPDPAMFRILSKLTGLTPHVIKIWFQNERSRQRRQVLVSEEVSREKKPYKCRDCGVEFAMPAFLVKHCMRHIPTDNVTSQARKCPICMVEFETQKLHSHFMASHNLSISMDEEGISEKNLCHLCQEEFPDLNSLSIHKNEHLKDTQYGDPPQCSECKTTFVNILCLEAHMATHRKYNWDHCCHKCCMKFYDKILLESHLMTHTLFNTNCNGVDTNKSNESNNQSQYLISLLQQFSDPKKLKPILPKEEANDNDSKIPTDKIGSSSDEAQKSDHEFSPQPPSANVSFKFIPIKFIPISSTSNALSSKNTSSATSNSVVTVISPQLLTIKDPHLNAEAKNNAVKNLESKAAITTDSSANSVMKTDKCLKKVPNLIPISDKTFPSKEINGPTQICSATNENNSDNNKVEESFLSDHDEQNDPAQILLYTPYASEYRKRRRTPTHFNSSQRDILEAYYKYDNFPDPSEQLHLSQYLNVPYSVIKTWFQNTRKNHRKHLKESAPAEVGGPFECSHCHVCFVSKIYIDSHINQHDEKQPYKCYLCDMQFPHQVIYDIHLKIGCSKKSKKKHDHIRQFSRPPLNAKFAKSENDNNSELNSHNQRISNVAFINVNYKELINSAKINGHTEYDKNGGVYNEEIIYHDCVYCSKKFSSSVSLNFHLRNAHEEETKRESAELLLSLKDSQNSCNSNSLIQQKRDLIEHDCILTERQDSLTENNPSLNNQTFILSERNRNLNDIKSLSFSELLHLYDTTKNVITVPISKCKTYIKSSNNKVKRLRRKRGKLSSTSISFLKLHYAYNNFASSEEMNLMSKRLSIPKDRVAYWFQKQRTLERKGNSVGYKPPHHCNSCSSIFVHIEALNEHELSVHNPEQISIQFICPIEHCKMKFPNETLLQTHQMSHSINKEEKRSSDFKVHNGFLEAHYTQNNFPSLPDVAIMARRLNLESRYIQWWFKERRARHLREFKNKNKPKTVELSHANGEKSVATTSEICKICNCAFLKEILLNKHLLTHITIFSLICFECLADFSNSLVFETHMLQHGLSCSNDIFLFSKSIKVKNSLKFKFYFIQLQVLCAHFKHNNFAKKEEVRQLSRRLKIPMKHVQMWFKTQRTSEAAKVKPGTISTNSLNHDNNLLTRKHTIENLGNFTCEICSSGFVTSHGLDNHTMVHKVDLAPFSCDACSKTFCHEVIRDTHTLSHYTGLGLKARVKSLERDFKNNIKKHISDCRDASLFALSEEMIRHDAEYFTDSDNHENCEETVDYFKQENGKTENIFKQENGEISNFPKTPEENDVIKTNHDSNILQIDRIEEDNDIYSEEEDDELKLVIDE